jgi:hypothetical protein
VALQYVVLYGHQTCDAERYSSNVHTESRVSKDGSESFSENTQKNVKGGEHESEVLVASLCRQASERDCKFRRQKQKHKQGSKITRQLHKRTRDGSGPKLVESRHSSVFLLSSSTCHASKNNLLHEATHETPRVCKVSRWTKGG